MLISTFQPQTVSQLNRTMTSQRNADLSRSQSGGSGTSSPTVSRSTSGGTKSPSSAESVDFRFLNFTHYQEAKDAQNRGIVRSHVTGVQHQRSRKAAAEQARKTQQVSPGRPSRSHTGSQSENDGSSPETPSPASPTASSSSSSSMVRLDPREIYVEEWQPYLRPVMEHYLTYMAIDLPETDTRSRDLIRTSYMALVLSDRASLHSLILVAAAHWNKVRPQQPHRINLLQLRGMAIQEVNQALADHHPGGRATSDRLIAAVGKMATYELLFGQRETFHTHMTGLRRMVSLRGGLQHLGLDGLLERILLYIDSNAANISGGSLYFPSSEFASFFRHPPPNRNLFLLGVQSQ